jgi:hypothetical protein
MILSALLALYLENALQAFNILLQIGAGTGLIFILRWFWWRINAFSELAAMIISFLIALILEFGFSDELATHTRLLLGVGLTTLCWLAVTWLTRPTDQETLLAFYKKIRPHDMGWRPVIQKGFREGKLTEAEVTTGQLPRELAAMFLGVFLVYSILFGTGYLLYGQVASTIAALIVAVVSGGLLWRIMLR